MKRTAKLISAIFLISYAFSVCACHKAEETTVSTESTVTEITSVETTEESVATETDETGYQPSMSMLSIGSVFSWGNYNGNELNWLVLDKSMSNLTVISIGVIEELTYNDSEPDSTWSDSTLRVWLNTDFYENSFTDEEKLRINYANITALPEVPADDRIYLLSSEEYVEYQDIIDNHPESTAWWLRGDGSDSNNDPDRTDIIDYQFNVGYNSGYVGDVHGVRPVMRFYCGNDIESHTSTPRGPTPIPTPSPTPFPEPDEDDPYNYDVDCYDLFMESIDAFEESDPGNYMFTITHDYIRSIQQSHWVLRVYHGGTYDYYIPGDDELVEVDLAEGNQYFNDSPDYYFSYDEIRSIPFIYDLHNDRLINDETTDDTVEDGTYFGGLIAVSDDGRYGYFIIGTPILYDLDYVLSLEIGDEIGYEDITVTGFRTMEDGTQWPILNVDEPYFSYSYYGYTGKVCLCRYSDCPVVENSMIVKLPIAEDAEITDRFSLLTSEESVTEWEAADKTGISILDSYFWYYYTTASENGYFSNGWMVGHGLSYPCVINNGEVTTLNLEWR